MTCISNTYGGIKITKKGRIIILIFMLVIFPIFSHTTIAAPTAEINIEILGGYWWPKLIHFIGGIIINYDLTTTEYNVTYNITVTGEINATTESSYLHTGPELPILVSIPDGLQGFGPVLITISVSTSNGYNTSKTAIGFQIGGFTWVPLSWSVPPLFKEYFPWLDWHPTYKSQNVGV